MIALSLLSTLFLAFVVSAGPVTTIRNSLITLSLSRRFNVTNPRGLYQHDLKRAETLKVRGNVRGAAKPINTSAENRAITYIAKVGVGIPPTTYDLIIDTGSSNTWVGSHKKYVKTSSATQTSNNVSVTYGSGSFSGTEFTDTVNLGKMVIKKQSIGVASTSGGFESVDGILGIGPTNLTRGTLSSDSNATIPTVTDNLFSFKTIPHNSIGISFEPTTRKSVANGELTWGGVDPSKFTGKIAYVPVTSTFPASQYWGIDQTITYGRSKTTILTFTAGIVDTGTTLLLLSSDAVKKYKAATGARFDPNTKLLTISTHNFSNLQSLCFDIGDTTFDFTPNAQIWPRVLNTAIGGATNKIYLIVSDLGTVSGQGLDFINGQVWLERFYTVYDTTNRRVGIAMTPFTYAKTN